MSQVRRIATNAVLLSAADIANLILGFFVAVSLARYLGAEGYGILSFALALTAIFAVFSDLGLQVLMIREIARDKSLTQKYAANVAVLKVILVTMTFGLTALAVNLMGYPAQTTTVVYLIALSTVFSAFSGTLCAIFRAHERMEFVTLGTVLGSGMTLAGVLLFVSRGYGLTAIATLYVAATAATLLCLSAVAFSRFVAVKFEVDLAFWRTMLKQAWPFGLVLVLWTVYFWVDSVMLSVMKGDEEVGLYNAAYRILVVLQLIPGAYWGAVFPLMSRLYMSSKASLLVILHKSLKYMLILALPIALGTTLLADRFVIQIFGADYEAAALGLQILTWTIVFQFLSASYVHLFNSVNRQMVVAFYLVFTLLANVVLNAVLIPKYGLVGASIATVVTGAMNLACAFVVSRRLGYAIPLKGLAIAAAKVVTASAAMGAFVKYFDSLHLLALVPAAAAVYFAVVLGLGAIDSEDTAMLRSALTGK